MTGRWLLVPLLAVGMALAQTGERAAPFGMRPLWPAPDRSGAPADGDAAAGRAVVVGGDRRAGWACVQCHGLDGLAEASGGIPSLAGQHAWYMYRQLHEYASGARANAAMTPIARELTEREMRDVSAWYAAQDARPPVRRESDLRIRQVGGAIHAVGIPERNVTACSQCHGVDGGGAAPAVPALAGQYAPYTALQLHLWKRGERSNGPLGVMAAIAAGMTDEEIAAVAEYYAALRLPAGPERARR